MKITDAMIDAAAPYMSHGSRDLAHAALRAALASAPAQPDMRMAEFIGRRGVVTQWPDLGDAAPAQPVAMTEENAKLREILALWVSGHAALYRDDGELQDNSRRPYIDYKRDSADAICAKLVDRNKRALSAQPEAKAQAAEQQRPHFEWWWQTRFSPPIGSIECRYAWYAWVASGGYTAPEGWKVAPQSEWGIEGINTAPIPCAAPQPPAPCEQRKPSATGEYQGVRCMCVLTSCRAGPGCPHYNTHCQKHIDHRNGIRSTGGDDE